MYAQAIDDFFFKKLMEEAVWFIFPEVERNKNESNCFGCFRNLLNQQKIKRNILRGKK